MVTGYRSFVLEAFDYVRDGGERFSVRVERSLVGTRTPPETVQIPSGLRGDVRKLAAGTLNESQILALGEQLGSLLFPATARDHLARSRERLRSGQGLRVELRFDSEQLAALPWEYAYVPRPDTPADQKLVDGFLALDNQTSIVRSIVGAGPPDFEPIGQRNVKLVCLFSDPATAEYPSLQLDVEQQKIAEALNPVARVDKVFRTDATAQTLLDVLSAGTDIFHFSGHGGFEATELGEVRGTRVGQGVLILLDDAGAPRKIAADVFVQGFRNRGVRLAFFGACEAGQADGTNPWSGIAAALLRAGVPAVVAMQYKVADANVIQFSRNFYHVLAEGGDIESAVMQGRNAIFWGGGIVDRDWGAPVLYMGGDLEQIGLAKLFPRDESIAVAHPPTPPSTSETELPAGTAAAGTTGAGAAGTAGTGTAGASPTREARSPKAGQEVNITRLRNGIVSVYSKAELEILCADIEQAIVDAGEQRQIRVSLDMVGGGTLPGIVQNLIRYLDGYGYLHYLTDAVRVDRPNLSF